MGNSKGRDNAKKRARRRRKTERLALAKNTKKQTRWRLGRRTCRDQRQSRSAL